MKTMKTPKEKLGEIIFQLYAPVNDDIDRKPVYQNLAQEFLSKKVHTTMQPEEIFIKGAEKGFSLAESIITRRKFGMKLVYGTTNYPQGIAKYPVSEITEDDRRDLLLWSIWNFLQYYRSRTDLVELVDGAGVAVERLLTNRTNYGQCKDELVAIIKTVDPEYLTGHGSYWDHVTRELSAVFTLLNLQETEAGYEMCHVFRKYSLENTDVLIEQFLNFLEQFN